MSVSLTARTKTARSKPSLKPKTCFSFGEKQLTFPGRPLIMGIVNVTPDSFSDGGQFLDSEHAIAQGLKLVDEGADLLDVGGESTRPGASAVSVNEELQRVIPVIQGLARQVQVPISVDTFKVDVARQALDAGASIINDVTAFAGDDAMPVVAARAKATVILMHMQGTPKTMQQRPRYSDVVEEVSQFLVKRVQCAEKAGISRSRIWIDPGLGFGKLTAHNLTLMRHLDRFVAAGIPVVIGPSRKSFIGEVLNTDVSDRLSGTLACAAWAYQAGVQMVRVHDVKAAVQLLTMLQAIRGS